MKICFIVGTRPEVIKVAPIILEAKKQKIPFFIIHSNQHYSPNMDAIFFEELKLPKPDYNLEVGSGKHGNQTGNIMIKMEPILEKENPDWVIVQGDTNTVLAGGLAASKLNVNVAHVEAGLRSYDRMMPEETNRIVTDHLSERCFAVTKKQEAILKSEGIDESKIIVVGNTIVDSVLHICEKGDSQILDRLSIKKKEFFLTTLHRTKNVDDKDKLKKLIGQIDNIASTYSVKIVWPIHPRTNKQIKNFSIKVPESILLIEPTNYSDFVTLEKNAKLILTDSGGVQEEACILKTPCITLRENTERPETVDVGANLIVGFDSEKIHNGIQHFLNMKSYDWSNPFGDGTTSQKIINEVLNYGSSTNKKTNSYNINVIGLGYMGLPLAGLLVEAGHKVHGVDINSDKVNTILKGECPFEEPGLPELLTRSLSNGLSASTTVQPAKIHIISVPTPHQDKTCDLSYVIKACESLLPVIQDGDLVIVESTIKPTTCSHYVKPVFADCGKKVLIAHCPERAIPGQTLKELKTNDRIVGGLCEDSTELASDVYESFVTGQVFKTTATTAETCKLLENTFRDINIALANEFDQVLSEIGVNSREAIRLANRHPRVNILTPGIGVGGHCIAIDPWFLIENVKNAPLIRTARKINDERPHVIVKKMLKHLSDKKNIGILGVSYKKNIGDMRETPVTAIVNDLTQQGYKVKYFDPLVEGEFHVPACKSLDEIEQWSDIIFELVDHDVFKNYKNKITYKEL